MFELGKASLAKLDTVEDDLVKVCHRAIQHSTVDFGIICGIRTPEEQAERLASGASQTKNSRHLANARGKSEAIDFGVYVYGKYVNGDTADEIGLYRVVNQAFIRAAIELGIQIECGCLWRTFVDAGHIQLLRK